MGLTFVRHEEVLASPLGGKEVEDVHAAMQSEIEAESERLRVAILACNPKELMGFLWGQLLLSQLHRDEGEQEDDRCIEARIAIDDFRFALEYVHAVLSSHPTSDHGRAGALEDVQAVLQLATELRAANKTMSSSHDC
ncbi:hypothetical protein [Cupriavidus necator]|uniref:hypothetical protein n=1 Tax=Cupriavidus necator TaxID=106590 RepID=UPI00099459F8|nr:hypothetical protein [Cupriavidus necator]